MKTVFRVIIFYTFAHNVVAQAPVDNAAKPLDTLIQEIESQYDVKIFRQSDWTNGKNSAAPKGNFTLEEQLDQILNGTGLEYSIYDENYVLIFKESGIDGTDSQINSEIETQIEYTLTGKVLTETTEEIIINATLYIDKLNRSIVSDTDGSYKLSLPAGQYQIAVSYIGFHTQRLNVDISSDLARDIYLYDKVTELKEVIIGSNAIDENVSNVNMGTTTLDIASIKKIPVSVGEVDVIKTLLTLPGVQSVGEGSSGFNVRGGSIDQNLILLDGAPIFNPSHVFGFFSIFNPDAVKDLTLYRGGIPAQFGGRLSSVLDVQLKEGDPVNHNLRGGVGLFASRLGADGPIKKGTDTYSFSGRASYSDWALNLFDDRELNNSSASFYDVSLKLSQLIGSKDRITASAYLSSDEFKFLSDTLYDWQSEVASLNWSHSFDTRLTFNIVGTYSDYEYGVNGRSEENEFDWKAGINHKAIKANLNYTLDDKNNFDFGIQSEWYRFKPGSLVPLEGSSLNVIHLEKDFSRNYAAYFNHELKVTDKLSVIYGLRYSLFQNLGPGTVFEFDENAPRTIDTITDSTTHNNGEVIESYNALEPRLSIRLGLLSSDAIKFSYNRLTQNIHLISNSTASNPVDIWQTSNNNIGPQIGDLFSLGYFRNFKNNTIETSAEIYYKSINDLVEFRDGATILLNKNIETDLLKGKGRSYGLELLVKKKQGLLTGWLSYTYSRTERKVSGPTPQETINFGQYFPANFDKPHDITMVGTYQLTRRVSLSTNFTYSTGRPVTFPDSQYRIGSLAVANFRERNQGRIPDYHRLDIALTLEGSHRKNKKWEGSWTFSIYNLYGRDNAFSVFFRSERSGTLPQAFKLSVIGNAFPSITYNFRFKG